MNARFSTTRQAIAGAAAALIFGATLPQAHAQNNSLTVNSPPAATATAPGAPALPYAASQVVKLYQGGVSKDVIVNFVQSSAYPYHLTADDIISLQKLGMPQEITQAMLQRDGQLQQQAAQQAAMMPTYPPPSTQPGEVAGQSPQVVMPTTPAPQVAVVGSDYPYYDYGYDYPYYGGWPTYIVGGWGWYGPGWGWRWCGPGWRGGWGWRGGFGGFRGGFRGGVGFGGGFRGGFGGFRGGFGAFHAGGGGFHGGGFGGGHGGGGHR